MKRILLHLLALVLSPTLLFAEKWTPTAPVVGEFSAAKYREIKWEPSFRGYGIGEVYVTPSRDWVVFSINNNLRTIDRSEVLHVGAYHPSSGRPRQLEFATTGGESEWSTQVIDGLRPYFVPLGGNRVGIVTEHSRQHAQEAGPTWKCFLWEWNLDTQRVRLVGPWNVAMVSIAQVVQLRQCRLCWTSDQKTTSGKLTLKDLASRKSTSVTLNPEVHGFDSDMQTYAPTGDPCAFAVCDPLPRDDVHVYCVDPNVPNGIRWKLDKATLEDTIVPNITAAGFPHHISFPCDTLPLVVYSVTKKEGLVYLAFLNTKTGQIEKRCRIHVDWMGTFLPIVSGNNRYLVDEISGLLMHEQGENEDPHKYISSTRFRVMDLQTEGHRDTDNLVKKLYVCFWGGFLSDDRVVVYDDEAIWTLDTSKDLQLRELFRLKGDEDFQRSLK